MKIFFHAPISDQYRDFYMSLYEYLSTLGHEQTSDFAIAYSKNDLNSNQMRKEAQDLLHKQVANIKKADVLVMGANEQSVGCGFFLNMAMKLSKPIVLITENLVDMPFFYASLSYNKLMTVECNNKNYRTVLPERLNEAKKQIDKRFTLLLPPDVVEMLDKHYKRSGQTRSDYIRDLIRQDQEKRQAS